ncbi:toxin-activating lysine-acyltransferase [Pseudoxanthomonas winnipegensis]|uniref:RTX toxin-activating lysine-acyltransferase n=1 Tax=Pseudoxanthomonas winnipegensis TaxID=2480810 RepID=A0A4Q8LVM3_9GAMM|nr:toxin-activating lysine-acyltransferase [Pseudoxanthomonas winnipegensis]TAA36122.1 toxin-activating lysine-acyltransferase [Pseudoxanthomonas winnipegensis]
MNYVLLPIKDRSRRFWMNDANISGDSFALIGAVAHLMSRSPRYCSYPIVCIKEWIEPAEALQQLKVFFDTKGDLSGYVAWAWLCEEAREAFTSDPSVRLRLSDWNGGTELWIIDFLYSGEDLRGFLKGISALFENVGSIFYLRRDDGGLVLKVMEWRVRSRKLIVKRL